MVQGERKYCSLGICLENKYFIVYCITPFPLQFFGTRPGCSPTALLLDLWEATVLGSERALLDLLQALRVLGRPDAVDVLEDFVPA